MSSQILFAILMTAALVAAGYEIRLGWLNEPGRFKSFLRVHRTKILVTLYLTVYPFFSVWLWAARYHMWGSIEGPDNGDHWFNKPVTTGSVVWSFIPGVNVAADVVIGISFGIHYLVQFCQHLFG